MAVTKADQYSEMVRDIINSKDFEFVSKELSDSYELIKTVSSLPISGNTKHHIIETMNRKVEERFDSKVDQMIMGWFRTNATKIPTIDLKKE